jgi:hypothetical protein
MRPRRSEEELLTEPEPVMYSKSRLALVDGIRSSFPNWHGAQPFDYRAGWTRMGDFFAEGYFLREEMRELVHNRFGVNIP